MVCCKQRFHEKCVAVRISSASASGPQNCRQKNKRAISVVNTQNKKPQVMFWNMLRVLFFLNCTQFDVPNISVFIIYKVLNVLFIFLSIRIHLRLNGNAVNIHSAGNLYNCFSGLSLTYALIHARLKIKPNTNMQYREYSKQDQGYEDPFPHTF